MSHDDELRSRLNKLSESSPLPDLDLHDVQHRGDARTRRSRAMAVTAIMVMVVGAAAVVRTIAFDDSPLDVAAGDETEDEADETPDDGESAGAEDAEPAAFVADSDDAGIDSDLSGFARAFGGYASGGPGWVVPWGNGFLSIGTVFGPGPAVELDEELLSLFPPEVVDAVEDAGATTIEEAMAVLDEVGLLDVATEIVLGDFELASRILSGAGGTSTFVAQISEDGSTWTDLPDFTVPGGNDFVGQVLSDGTHLLVTSQAWDEDGGETSVSITTDLSNWTTVAIPTGTPADLPEHVSSSTSLNAVAIGPNGWYVSTQTGSWVDFWELIPADLQTELERGSYGWSTSAEGIVLESYDELELEEFDESVECCEPTVVRVVPWTELGIDYDTIEPYLDGSPGSSQAWTGSWSGELTAATTPGGGDCCRTIGTDAGFLSITWGGEYYEGNLSDAVVGVFFSPDGVDWVERDAPPGGWIDGLAAVDGGVLAMVSGEGGQTIWRADADGSNWQPTVVPDLPDNVYLYFPAAGGRGVAAVIDAQTYEYFEPPPVEYEGTLEYEGVSIYSHRFIDGHSDVIVTDIATGEVLLEATVEVSYPEALPDFVELAGNGVVFRNPAGDIVADVPVDLILDAISSAENAALAATGWEEPVYSAEFWVVASRDGLSWFSETVPELTVDNYDYGQVALNGNRVAVPLTDGWLTFDIG